MPTADMPSSQKREAPSTGDTGPPAKRPRQDRVMDSELVRHYAFKDWLTCTIKDNNGNLPLHCAVITGDINQVKRQCYVLVARNGTLDVPNFDGETPLHLAIVHRHATVVQLLIKFGARPQFRDYNGNSAFHLACQRDVESPGILRSLLAAPNVTPYDLEAINDQGYSALHLCAMYDKVQELEALLSRKADVNVKDAKSGRTPLFHAVENNSSMCCRVLLSQGANSMEQNFAGHTPIIAASEFTTPQIEPMLKPNSESYSLLRTLHRNIKV